MKILRHFLISRFCCVYTVFVEGDEIMCTCSGFTVRKVCYHIRMTLTEKLEGTEPALVAIQ